MSSSTYPRVSIVIPTLNEAENIQQLISRVLQSTNGLEVEIIVVDDNSKDGTQDQVLALEKTAPVRLLERKKPEHGLTGAVLAGARAAKGGIVVVMDADLSHPPERIPDLVGPISDNQSDMVIGSRYAPGGATPGWPAKRRWMSRAASTLAWPLTDVHDALGGFFAVKRELLADIPPDAAGFKIALEVLVRGGDDLRVQEIPIAFVDRTHGQSKMGSKVIFTYFKRLFVLAGGRFSHGSVTKIAAKALAVWLLDFALFACLLGMHLAPMEAHIASFTLAGALSYFFFRRENASLQTNHPSWVFPLRFLLVFFMALILRSGLLGALTGPLAWNPFWAIWPALAMGGLVKYIGSCFFIWPIKDHHGSGIRWRVISLGLLCYFCLMRLLYMGQTDLLPEEAYYWSYSRNLDNGYLDHPPMISWLIHAGTTLFGHNAFGVRIPIFFCWIAAAVFMFKLAQSLYDKSTAFRTLLLMQLLPIFFMVGLVATPDAPLVACWSGMLYFLHRALLHQKASAWLAVGLMFGLGLLSKYTIGLLGIAGLVFILLDRPSWRWLWHPAPYLAGAFSLLVASPVIVWNAQHNWMSFNFQSTRRLKADPKFSTHILFGSILGLLTPTGFLAAIRSLICGAETQVSPKRKALFMRVFTLVPLAVFLLFSFRNRPQFNWTGPLWLAVLPAIAAALSRKDLQDTLGRWLRILWNPTLAVVVITSGLLLHYLAFGLPGVGYSSKIELLPVGWSELGKEIEVIAEQEKQRTGAEPLSIGLDKYFIASQMAFYNPDPLEGIKESANRNFVGGRGLMYSLWFKPNNYKGRTLLAVTFEPEDLDSNKFESYFESLGPIQEGRLVRHGRYITSYYYRFGYGYRGSK